MESHLSRIKLYHLLPATAMPHSSRDDDCWTPTSSMCSFTQS